MEVILSKSLDPFYHLSFEDWLLRSPEAPVESIYFYQNAPSVVMGRFQNPWQEVNLPYLRENKINFVRRMSGGGCVYQDLGNLNISWVGPLQGFQKKKLLALIQNQLQKMNIEVQINERNDLLLSSFKISGSAFKQTKDRALHHATLLINSDLTHLSKSLKTPFQNIESKSIPSVRSKVTNILAYHPQFNLEDWLFSWGKSQSSQNFFEVKEFPFKEHNWLWGETPWFQWQVEINGIHLKIESKKGKIIKVESEFETSGLMDQWLNAETFYHWKKDITYDEWLKVLGV